MRIMRSKIKPVLLLVVVVVSLIGSAGAVQAEDEWPDSGDNAPIVSPDSDLSGTIDTAEDIDTFRMQLSEGDSISMLADVPIEEERFRVTYEAVEGEVSIRDVKNGNRNTFTRDSAPDGYIHEIDSLSNASWTVWAETDTIVEFRLYGKRGE